MTWSNRNRRVCFRVSDDSEQEGIRSMNGIQGQAVDVALRSLEDARLLIEDGEWEKALSFLEGIVMHDDIRELEETAPGIVVETLSLLGVVFFRLGNLGEALFFFKRVEVLEGVSSDISEVLAVLHALAGRLADALYYGKLATTQSCDNRILDVLGPSFPTFADAFININEKPLYKKGMFYLDNVNPLMALSAFEQQLSFDGRDTESLLGKARALLSLERGSETVRVLRFLRQLLPGRVDVISMLGTALTKTGEVLAAQECHRLACTLDGDSIAAATAWLRDASMFPGEATLLRERAYEALLHALDCEDEDTTAPEAGKVTMIGCLVVDLRQDQAEMIGRVLLNVSIPLVLYGRGELTDSWNKPFQGIRATWRNVAKIDGYTFAEVMRGDGITILVNASGWRAPEYLLAHPQRAVPIQVSWMNAPFHTLFPGIDWRLEWGDVEGGWKLPHGAYCASLPSLPQTERAAGCRDDLVFGVSTTLEFITPDVAMCWSRILLEKPEAQLLLRDCAISDPDARQRLIAMFGDFGVAHRIEIAEEENVVLFMAGIDVLLVPFREAQIEGVPAALIQGVPVIVLDYSGRVLTSMLDMAGFGEQMVATDEDDYVAKALKFGDSRSRRGEARSKAEEELPSCPIFDAVRLADDLVEAFSKMRETLHYPGE